jgi:hypothetical protein
VDDSDWADFLPEGLADLLELLDPGWCYVEVRINLYSSVYIIPVGLN